jgi:hypothetical protein
MRRLLPAMALLLILAPAASAQMAPPPQPPPVPIPAQIGAQAGVETSYLLALYMTALANAGRAPTPSDIDEATRQYLTNGAAVTGVPGSGPGSAYFQNGAGVTAVPGSGAAAAYFQNGASVLAYPSSTAVPAAPAAPTAMVNVDAGPGAVISAPVAVDAGAPESTDDATSPAAAPVPSAAVSAGWTPPAVSAELPAETSATYATTPPAAPSCPQCTPTPQAPAIISIAQPEASLACPPGPSPLERLATGLGGALVGGLAVVLWTRPRPPPRKQGESAS